LNSESGIENKKMLERLTAGTFKRFASSKKKELTRNISQLQSAHRSPLTAHRSPLTAHRSQKKLCALCGLCGPIF
jgi:uracil DNA glycosylase